MPASTPCPLMNEGGFVSAFVVQCRYEHFAANLLIITKKSKYTLKLRPATLENIEKMIHCGDPSFGGAMYGCSSCGALKFVPFRCKSRFCPSCGTLYSIHRTTSMSLKLIQCIHRHCVFTIPEELRISFRRDRSLLNCLFYSVRDVILRMFRKPTNPNVLLPVLSVSSTPSAAVFNGISHPCPRFRSRCRSHYSLETLYPLLTILLFAQIFLYCSPQSSSQKNRPFFQKNEI